MSDMEEFDVAFSFAGEDREYVDQVANHLRESGIKIFYDRFFEVELWGKDLYQHFADLYKNKAKYVIIFASEYYARKRWTNAELKAAQARAFTENSEYILPARFDDTEIPGIHNTIAYIDLSRISPSVFAEMILKKLGFVIEIQSAPEVPLQPSTIIFDDRMRQVFPGRRGEFSYTDAEALVKLTSFLREPLIFADGKQHPFWWWRGPRGSSIREFSVVDEYKCLIYYQEIVISKMVIYRPENYEKSFVYIESHPEKPSGVYDYTSQEYIDQRVAENGYSYEEFAEFEGKYITRAEFDDGYADIDGVIVDISEYAKLRKRYHSKYNFIIAPQGSPINNRKYDTIFKNLLDGILLGKYSVKNLISMVEKLPQIHPDL